MGAKEGVTEGLTALVGSDITDTVLRSADGKGYKGIDEYSGAGRPATTNVLYQLVEVITYVFDFRKKTMQCKC